VAIFLTCGTESPPKTQAKVREEEYMANSPGRSLQTVRQRSRVQNRPSCSSARLTEGASAVELALDYRTIVTGQ
jgi:hypothetical protein